MPDADSAPRWKDVALTFLKLGATSYGGPAIMGIMQAELVEKQRWVSRERFVEGLSLVNMLPGATATQLGIFLGYIRGGWWAGLVAGLCFMLPAFFTMLALTIAYATLGVTPIMRGALYGLGPVVLGIFMVAVYRLGRSTTSTVAQAIIAVGAAAALLVSPLGVAAILLLAGAAGLFVFHSKTLGAVVMGVVAAILVAWWLTPVSLSPATRAVPSSPGLVDVGMYFFKVGAFTVGGGLTMIAFIQDQVVEQFHWLTPREFIDGLALGQFTPGPVLMLAAYVGYKMAGVAAPRWPRAAVIGVLAVSLFRLMPHALPDPFAVAMLIATVTALAMWRVGTIKLMVAGSLLGILRSRLRVVTA